MGKRLGPETYDKTKAMVKVNQKTLIERCLDCAVLHPIDRIILVVGYEKEKLKSFLGDSYKGVDIVYVENNDYATTNNIYSIFLAKDYLVEDDTILIESDLIFEPKLLQMVVQNKFENLALVDKYKPWMDGTVVKINNDFSISHFISKADFDYNKVHEYYKTVNIYKFSKSFLASVYVPFLEAYAKAMGNNEYYEQVLKVIVNLDTRALKALPLDGEVWYEVDDAQDLDNASLLFAEPNERYKLLSQRYGGYWRFDDLKDFCYLVRKYKMLFFLLFHLLDKVIFVLFLVVFPCLIVFSKYRRKIIAYYIGCKTKNLLYLHPRNYKEIKLCRKEHFNHQIEREKINTVLWIACQLLMDNK